MGSLVLGANTDVVDWEERQAGAIEAVGNFLYTSPDTSHILGLNDGYGSVTYPDDTVTLLEVRSIVAVGKKRTARIDAGVVIGLRKEGASEGWYVERIIVVMTLPMTGGDIAGVAMGGKLQGEQVCIDMVATHDQAMAAALMGGLCVGLKYLRHPTEVRHVTKRKEQRKRVLKRLDRAEHSYHEEGEEDGDDYEADSA